MISEKNLSLKLSINLKKERLRGAFKQGVHYFKYSPRKIVYDENTMDELIRSKSGNALQQERDDLGELISKWAEDTKVHEANRYKREQKAS